MEVKLLGEVDKKINTKYKTMRTFIFIDILISLCYGLYIKIKYIFRAGCNSLPAV